LEVQQLAWPVISTGSDAVIISEAGSGKTLSYLLPLVQLLLDPPDEARASRAVVALPSADLALQVLRVAQQLTKGTRLVCAPAASAGSPRGSCGDVIVGTVPDCLPYVCEVRDKKSASAPPVLTRLVVDEVDILLAGLRRKGRAATGQPVMQMLAEVRRGSRRAEKAVAASGVSSRNGFEALERERAHQLVMVSATVPAQGDSSVGALINELFPSIQWVRSQGAHRPIERLASSFISVENEEQRREALLELVRNAPNRTLVFANSAARANDVAKLLRAAGVAAGAYHPGLDPAERAAAADAFNLAPAGVLACSGLAARGLDFAPVGLVVQYQLAPHMVEYMHRVGRTARAGREGAAVALVLSESESEAALVKEVQRCIRGSWKYV
jgi:superfamily II DNA/RNA helicase